MVRAFGARVRTERNCRSLHSATPDFLLILVALSNFMRLSLLKAAHAVLSRHRIVISTRGVMGGRPIQGNEKRSVRHPLSMESLPFPCHPDRSVPRFPTSPLSQRQRIRLSFKESRTTSTSATNLERKSGGATCGFFFGSLTPSPTTISVTHYTRFRS